MDFDYLQFLMRWNNWYYSLNWEGQIRVFDFNRSDRTVRVVLRKGGKMLEQRLEIDDFAKFILKVRMLISELDKQLQNK